MAWVRMKPYDPQKGFVRENFRVHDWGEKGVFRAGEIRQVEPMAAAEWLGRLRQMDGDERSPLLFDIYATEEDAAKAIADERLADMESIARFAEPEDTKPPALSMNVISQLNAPIPTHEVELLAKRHQEKEAEDGVKLDASEPIVSGREFADVLPDENELAAAASAERPAVAKRGGRRSARKR